ncbi:HNH endonuclease [Vibrio quintilis]|uniref:Uncharacterized protein n=1 Tax=Vibrio quintilis TaxID=1117707 RepID=A0A1M7YZ91_9VIBR|nr:HNH endonuclease [Vibrio quintilis]SHO58017.1 hypothetical protein VQ7734_03787 [Vibrio quintilis]
MFSALKDKPGHRIQLPVQRQSWQGMVLEDHRKSAPVQARIHKDNRGIQRAVIQRHDAATISLKIISNKDTYGMQDVSDSSVRLFVRNFFAHNTVNDSTRESTVINTVVTAIKSYLKPDSGSGHVPSDKETEKDVNGTTYRFYNDTDGCLEFMCPKGGKPKCPKAPGTWEVNIEDGGNPGKTKFTGNPLNSGSRPQHFKVSNMIYEGTPHPVNGDKSPAGYTWHHHKDRGKMQLIDRDVHASFSHKGGYSIWGS